MNIFKRKKEAKTEPNIKARLLGMLADDNELVIRAEQRFMELIGYNNKTNISDTFSPGELRQLLIGAGIADDEEQAEEMLYSSGLPHYFNHSITLKGLHIGYFQKDDKYIFVNPEKYFPNS